MPLSAGAISAGVETRRGGRYRRPPDLGDRGFPSQAEEAVERYAAQTGGTIIAEYMETESGAKSDRPQLAKALAHCRRARGTLLIVREDFTVTTSNKLLNFLQHIMTILKPGGTAAVVLPDNVLFEGGAGEAIRRRLLKDFNFHTLLRLPTGIFYKQGVKANVLFFEKVAAGERIAIEALWVYDFRTNQRFTLRERPLKRADFDDFVAADRPNHLRHTREDSERLKRFGYKELAARDKLNLYIFWLKDDGHIDPDSLPLPDEVAAEIVENIEAALERFRKVAAELAG